MFGFDRWQTADACELASALHSIRMLTLPSFLAFSLVVRETKFIAKLLLSLFFLRKFLIGFFQ